MKRWLKRVRGAFGIALTWAITWSGVGAILGLAWPTSSRGIAASFVDGFIGYRMKKAVKGSGRSITFVLIGIFGGASTEMAAQEPLASGSRVRVTAPDCALRGEVTTFLALRGDALVLETTECPLASVTQLDVSRGQKSHTRLGAVIGSLTGALSGAVIGFSLGDDPPFLSGEPFPFSAGNKAAIGFFLGGLGGAIIGVQIGSGFHDEQWEEVPLERLSVSLAPQRDGRFALGFSVRF